MSRNSQQHDKNNHSHHQHYHNHLRQQQYNHLEVSSSESMIDLAESSNPVQSENRVLRCFCGCSPLTYQQVETVAMMNVNGVVNNPLGNNLLKTFLKIGHRTDKSNALLLLECYELCDKVQPNISSYQEHLDDLFELCPSFIWEQRINDAIEDEDLVNIRLETVLNDLKRECLCSIESDNDFHRFRLELLRKIGK